MFWTSFVSILAEEFLTSRETYEREAKKHTEEMAGRSLDDMEMVNEMIFNVFVLVSVVFMVFGFYFNCILFVVHL